MGFTMSKKKSNIAISKINRDHYLLKNLDCNSAIQNIIENYNQKTKGNRHYLISKPDLEIDGMNVTCYHKKRITQEWFEFLKEIIDDKEKEFQNINHDFLCFFFDNLEIYAITAGSSFNTIQFYIDDSFPFEIGKKLLAGDFKQIESRELTGASYSKIENYRRNYTLSRQESFGKIWKRILGALNKDVIKEINNLALLLDLDKKTKTINALIKSSFTIRKSFQLQDIVKLINTFKSLPDLNDEQKRKFLFLDTIKDIKKDMYPVLYNELIESLYNIYKNDSFDEADSFDFCHPKSTEEFLYGYNYNLKGEEFDDVPYLSDILLKIKEKKLLNEENLEEFKMFFKKEDITFSFEDYLDLRCNLKNSIHGEVKYGSNVYFLIDCKFYQTVGTFLNTIKEDFIEEVFNKKIIINYLPLITWEKNIYKKEKLYNIECSNVKGFIHGDECFLKTERGEIELFDLIFSDDNNTYIIQVKNGFGASMRNACSQIKMAADLIEQDLRDNKKNLRNYYHNNNMQNIELEEFLNLFDKSRHYVLACSTEQKFEEDDFKNEKLFSHIAKYEVLSLINDMKNKQLSFFIQHINKV